MKNLSLNSRILLVLAFILAQLCLPMQSIHAATTATTEAYAVLSTDNKTLTFYYDTYKSSRVGTIYDSSKFTKTWSTRGWSTDDTTITTVTFNSSFSSYTSLTSTAYWFYGMENLATINGLTYLYTGNVTSMYDMFCNCKSLTSLNLSGFNTAKVTNMSFMFYNCSSLTSLNVSSFNTAKVTDMALMFYYCQNLTSLNVSSFNTAKVTDMGGMFYNCNSLTSLDLSNFSTANVTSMWWMFYGCKGLTSLNVSSFDTSKVTDMGGMFYNCNSLTSLDLSSFNTGMVQSMSYSYSSNNNTYYYGMFKNCSNLVTIRVGNQWTTANVTSSTEMFYNCTKLVGGDGTVYNSNYTDKTKAYAGIGGYLTMEGQAGAREAYAVLSTDGTTLTFYYDANKSSRPGTIYTSNNFRTSQSNGWGGSKSTITTVTFNSSFANYTSLTSTAYWFDGMENLTTINGLSYLKTNNVTTMRNMFYNCKNLTSLNLSGFNTAKVTVMWNMFYNCQNLTSLDLSSFNTANVNDMDNLFYNCSKLVTIRVSSLWTTASVTYSSSMFYNCTSLVGGDGTVYDPNYTDKTKAYAGIGGYLTMYGQETGTKEAYAVLSTDNKTLTFYYDTYKSSRVGTIYDSSKFTKTYNTRGWSTDDTTITTVTFNSSFSSYTSLTSTAYWFYGMENLTTINGLSYLKTNNVTTMSSMFSRCKSLTSLSVSSFNTANVIDMESMFYNCECLTNLNLSNFITANVTDMGRMFGGCKGLTSLNVSSFNTAKVTNMYDMFYNCQSLTSLNLSNFSTANVTNMGWMFDGCKGLTSLNVSSFNTAKVTSMYSMFSNCESLTSLDLSNFSTANVTNMTFMFGGCKALTSLNVSSFNTASVTDMSDMFYSCNSLTSLDLNSFNTGMVQSMSDYYYSYDSNNNTYTVCYIGMFGNCSNLETIRVGSQWTTDAVTSSTEMFNGCTSLVGGDGTTYDENYTDKTKAYAGRGGYLTLKVDDDLQYYLNSLTDSEDSFEDGVYTRQFTNWDWQTLYVPFSMSYSDWQARFEVASIMGVQQGENGPELVATILEEGTTEPNTPYLIRAKVKAKSTLKVNATNIVDPQENVFGVASYNIHGNYGTLNNLKENQKYRLRCNAFSIPESNDEVLPPYRWYLANKLVLVVDTITVICFSSIADGETTAVSEPMRKITERRANNEVYDLLGRKVRTDADGKAPLRKGLYIINNKKRIVK